MRKLLRQLLKWAKGNKWMLLAALGVITSIVVGGWVERSKYEAKMKRQLEAYKAAVTNQEKTIKRLEGRKIEEETESTVVEVFDRKTGRILNRTRVELRRLKEEHRKVLAEKGKAPRLPLPGQEEAGLYPLGGWASSSRTGVGGGLKWCIAPRLVVPLLPDPSLSLGFGWHDGMIGILLVDLHKN